MSDSVTLRRDSNQAMGIAGFAKAFLAGQLGPGPSQAVLDRTVLFHTDAVLCGISALALRANAPRLLREEALDYPDPNGARVFGSPQRVKPEKAVAANASAVREWDSNGTNFGYNPARGAVAGEFGHNDYYGAPVAACQETGQDGGAALRAMVLLDEIRGRLAEVFSLKDHAIDHVVHGAIASAAVYGSLHGASEKEIESAIGMFVAHYIPWRAIRAGKQLSDSKGASAALSAEAAVLCVRRAIAGFAGPQDIFRNPESLFRQFSPTRGDSPFDLTLTHSGDDFAVMGMHFKLGLYEHQSAGGIQGLIDLIAAFPALLEPGTVNRITVKAYQPAFGIIGDPAKRDPQTRQSADHSMVYILATILRKAIEQRNSISPETTSDSLWKLLMLTPWDYSTEALHNPSTRALMSRIEFEYGGPEYDARYPDGIPTSVHITDSAGKLYETGIVMYPAGHARNHDANLPDLLNHKFQTLGKIALKDANRVEQAVARLQTLGSMTATDLAEVYEFDLEDRPPLS